MNVDSLDTVHDFFHFGLLMIKELSWATCTWDIHHIEDTSVYLNSLFDLLLFIEEHLMFMGQF